MHNHHYRKMSHSNISRKNDVTPPAPSSLLTLPSNLWRTSANEKIGVSITSVGSEVDGIRVMGKLSQLSKDIHAFFKPELEKRTTKQLLSYVLQGNEEKVVKIAKSNPKLFFIKATTSDYAMDLEGHQRTIKDWSPYQALFGTGDKVMLKAVKPYLDAYLKTQHHGYKLAAEQEKEKFPHGFDFPACTDTFNQLVDELATTITNDQSLRQTGKPSETTLNMLAQFRKYLTPGIVETGHHFNMNELIKTYGVCEQQWKLHAWNEEQFKFFYINAIGFQQRLMTAPYLQAACMGLEKYVLSHQPLQRNFNVTGGFTHRMIMIAPFTERSSYCLGKDIFIDSYDGTWCIGHDFSQTTPRLEIEKLCQATIADFSKAAHGSRRRIDSSCIIS